MGLALGGRCSGGVRPHAGAFARQSTGGPGYDETKRRWDDRARLAGPWTAAGVLAAGHPAGMRGGHSRVSRIV